MGKETIEAEGCNPLLDTSSLLTSVDVMEFQTTDAYSSLDRTSAMYSLSIDSIEEKLEVIHITN
jgi:hypothetical protein